MAELSWNLGFQPHDLDSALSSVSFWGPPGGGHVSSQHPKARLSPELLAL